MNLQEALNAVDQTMMDIVQSDVPVLQEASRHIISAGGKRIRPQIMFHAYTASGGDEIGEAVPVAAALELVHTATLVHDDINDHGYMRRGRVTINEQWGRTFALLTGDFLFTKVYELMAPFGDLNITFAEATVALVEGETLQAQAAKTNTLDRDVYQTIVAKKTASLFRASAMLGAQLAGASKEVVEKLGEYGFYLGLIFQIVDDLLDLVGDSRLTGKTVGIDIAQGKGVAIAQTAGNGKTVSGAATAIINAETEDVDDPILAIKKRLVENGAVDEGHMMAQAIAIQAHSALDQLPDNELIEALRNIITVVLDRQN